jgi:hypothetical protein
MPTMRARENAHITLGVGYDNKEPGALDCMTWGLKPETRLPHPI